MKKQTIRKLKLDRETVKWLSQPLDQEQMQDAVGGWIHPGGSGNTYGLICHTK